MAAIQTGHTKEILNHSRRKSDNNVLSMATWFNTGYAILSTSVLFLTYIRYVTFYCIQTYA